MKFTVMTLFPEMVLSGLNTSIIGRAQNAGIIKIEAVNIRDYSTDKHRHVDDYPYGGGAGMVMMAEPIYRCFLAIINSNKESDENTAGKQENADLDTSADMRENGDPDTATCQAQNDFGKIKKRDKPRVIYLTPQGRVFDQNMAKEFAKEEELIFLCGHYEGVDQRVLDEIVTDDVSIGDYVLSGGELPAMVMIDAISRMVPGVLTNSESGTDESFEGNLLEYPQYTHPSVWMDKEVPEVLLSGHHANIEKWRRQKQLEKTLAVRPELLEKAELSKKDREYLNRLSESKLSNL